MWIDNNFSHVSLSVCLPVYVSLQTVTFELLQLGTSIFFTQIHLYNICVKFEYQDHLTQVNE